jgi:DNA-binding IclR family transcriptional regulator
MTVDRRSSVDWVHVIQAEYLEMPGLQLTMAQVRRLWGLEDQACRRILEQLVATGFLRRTARDLYVLDAPSC